MNETQPTLPKWPFYIGDALLVGIALLLAFRGGGPLDAAQMFWIIGAVGLGAVLFVLPYIIEYRTRVTISQTSRETEIWENTERMELALDSVAKLFAQQKRDREAIDRSLAFLEGLSRQLDQRLAAAAAAAAVEDGTDGTDGTDETDGTDGTDGTDETDESTGEAEDIHRSYRSHRSHQSEEPEPTEEPESTEDPEPTEEPEPAEDPEPTEEPEPAEDPEPAEEPEPAGDLEPAGEAEADELEQQELISVPGSSRRARKRVKGSVLVVDALIGIGNKPYLRGEGGGLSWEKGVPMEFVEIGKWQWLAGETGDDIRCRIYRNDEVEAEGDEIVIPAGQRVSVAANFPRS